MTKNNEFYDKNYTFERERGETPNHWLLRKLFLEQFHSEINKSELNALAQMYANMEEMNCIYPPNVTKKIKILTKDFGLKMRYYIIIIIKFQMIL